MTKRYVPGKCRKSVHRGRRRGQGKKVWILGVTAVILLFAVIAAGSALQAGFNDRRSAEGIPVTLVQTDHKDNNNSDPGIDDKGDNNSDPGIKDKGNNKSDPGIEDKGDNKSDSGIKEQGRQSAGSDVPWYLTLVNRQNPIPKDYKPKLVKVPGGEYVDERIYDSLMCMLEDAEAENWYQMPRVVSGWRTADTQQKLYDDKIAEYEKEGYSAGEARKLAEQWVAVPGYSEHQLGFAVDINGVSYDVYSWLMENSYKYGFIFRYPGDKTEITGVAEEVWHYRYVGVEAAAEMYEKGLCLEEYIRKGTGGGTYGN